MLRASGNPRQQDCRARPDRRAQPTWRTGPSFGWISSALLCGVVLAVDSGCSRWARKPDAGVQLLRPAVAADDSVTLEVFFARFTAAEEALLDPAWNEVDEQPIPVPVRQRLTQNGFRTGLVSGNLPVGMARVLKLDEQHPVRNDGRQTVDLQSEPTVCRRLLQLRHGQPGYLAKSEVRDSLPVLWYQDDQLQGRTFVQGQCMFAVTTSRRAGGGIALELIPELHYGQATQQYSGEHGVLRIQFARPKQVFADLGIRVDLVPGQMLVVGGYPDRPGSLGQQFFSAARTLNQERKLLVVRLLHTAPDDPFRVEDEPPTTARHATSRREPAAFVRPPIPLYCVGLVTDHRRGVNRCL
ncbi:MAG: hypothetical protein A2W31_06220 [Planctomycetes bacterium RBG_16_64_10]|nr:MAG: hypothetical protein A2W31_06220 [Planctomycetes bacterium RBG_16_64_10]